MSGNDSASDIVVRERAWQFDQGERFVRSWPGLEAAAQSLPTRIALGVVHGLGDHSGRFDDLGRWFANRGVDVYCYDQIGHGKSPGPRMTIPGYRYLLDDVESFLGKLTSTHPDSCVVLFGQSMGGNLVLNHQLRGYSKPALAIAGSPMFRVVNPPGALLMLLYRILARLAPNHTLAAPVDPANLSRDLAEQRAFEADPLVQRKISLRLGKALIDSGTWALKHAAELSTPTLVTHGDADLITCHRSSIEFAQSSSGQAALQIWPHGTHDLHHDIIREEYLSSVFDWMVSELQNRTTSAPVTD
jgi:alpha-beta hydrolase superfamily lysophospholipase